MNLNLKAATLAIVPVAALIASLGTSPAFAGSAASNEPNSDNSWVAYGPVEVPAADLIGTESASVQVQPAHTQVDAASAAPEPAQKSVTSAPIASQTAPVSLSVPPAPTVAVTSISKTAGDPDFLAKSPWVHSEPRPVAPFPLLLNRSVQEYVDYFLDQPAGLKLAFERSRPFLRDMIALLKQQGLPDDLVYLTFAESGFTKKGKGPWQFTAVTAARFGLRVNKWLDERRDPILSTKAAAEYLAELHDQADNDWRVALIAWNTGEGNLERYWSLQGANYTKFADRLPRRTRQLLNRFMAVAFIAHNAAAYGIGDVKYTDESRGWTERKFKGGTPLISIAAKFETTVSKLRELNPALRADRIPPNLHTYAIRIPTDDDSSS